jgi:hypothetical protein
MVMVDDVLYLHAKWVGAGKQVVQPVHEASIFYLSNQQGGELWLGHHVLLAFRGKRPAVMEEMNAYLGDEVTAEHVGGSECFDLIRHHEREVGLHFGWTLLKGAQLVGSGDLFPSSSTGFGHRWKQMGVERG